LPIARVGLKSRGEARALIDRAFRIELGRDVGAADQMQRESIARKRTPELTFDVLPMGALPATNEEASHD